MSASTEASLSEAQARRLEAVHEQLMTLLTQPEVAQRLRLAPGDSDWSASQILGHMIEMIPYWLGHCRGLIAATEPPNFGRALDAPERLAGVNRGAIGNADELLRLLNDEVQAAVKTIRQMSMVERSKKGIHIRRGEMTVADIVELFIVAHAEDHLVQVQAVLRT